MQLNIFAGQLYLKSFSEYQRLCEFLGVASPKTAEGMIVAADGLIMGGNQTLNKTFENCPLNFLEALMSKIRKDSQDIEKTHLGQILDGRLLTSSDFQDPEAGSTTAESEDNSMDIDSSEYDATDE